MGYQFIHVECYARSAGAGKAGGRTIGDVVAEAEREPAACPHVALIRPPVRLFGMSPTEAGALASGRAAEAKDAAGRKFRKDGLCMVAGVVSFPDDWDSVDSDSGAKARWSAWEAATVNWLRQHYGDQLASVIRHGDENHPHVHFYVVPRPEGERLRIGEVHTGRQASEAAKAAGLPKGEQNEAYKQAMREYQNRYWESVGLRHGLMRLGPGKRRLTRAGWQAEKVAAKAAASAMTAADRAAANADSRQVTAGAAVERAKLVLVEAKKQAVEALAAADKAEAASRVAEQAAREKARAIISTARAEGRRLVAEAETRAAPLRRLGGRLGAMWSALRGVESRLGAAADAQVAAAKRAAAMEVARAKEALRAEARIAVRDELDGLRRAADQAERERREADERAATARAAAAAAAEKGRHATAGLITEQRARRAAESERERFRGAWAEADNALIALHQPAVSGRLR